MLPRTPTAFVCSTTVIIAVSLSALASPIRASADSDALAPVERSLRILELEAEIRAAREQLTDLISETASPDGVPLRDRPELSAVAVKLARIAEELRVLRTEIAEPRDDDDRR